MSARKCRPPECEEIHFVYPTAIPLEIQLDLYRLYTFLMSGLCLESDRWPWEFRM